MLPPSHIIYTLAAWAVIKNHLPDSPQLDARLLALVAVGPDMVDKPLAALYFYRRYKSAVLFAHTMLVHLAVLALTLWFKPRWWPYTLAFNGHALLDRLWLFSDTWYWPWRGWRFHVWRNEQADIKQAYWYAFTHRPELWGWEVGGVLVGLWLIWRYRLYRPAQGWAFLSAGRLQR